MTELTLELEPHPGGRGLFVSSYPAALEQRLGEQGTWPPSVSREVTP